MRNRSLPNLEGPVAPEPWRGALPITYHIGPGPAVAHLKVENDTETRPVFNVIATIRGSELPDEWVLYGNHHDAWVNGAHDPASGAVAVLESARTLSELRKSGWQPKRTIKFALWDAEEFGLIGSTEWVEKHEPELKQKLIAYFNSDTNGKGQFSAGGSPSLHVFMRDIVRDVLKPAEARIHVSAGGIGLGLHTLPASRRHCQCQCGLWRFRRCVPFDLRFVRLVYAFFGQGLQQRREADASDDNRSDADGGSSRSAV